MKASEALIASGRDLWDSFVRHPFVEGITEGTLPKEKFQYYMIQDYLYLMDYARVFALGTAKAADLETAKIFGGYVKQITDGEMAIHRSYMKRLGIPEEKALQTPPAQDCLSYTSYMLREAYEGGPAEIAASILSCAVSYEYIAKAMLKRNPACGDHPFYGEWVHGYACEEYAEENRMLEHLTDRLCEGLPAQRMETLRDIFVRCTRYEGAFWDMGWEMRT
jgi:thiaminase/transcriptional activator TenA